MSVINDSHDATDQYVDVGELSDDGASTAARPGAGPIITGADLFAPAALPDPDAARDKAESEGAELDSIDWDTLTAPDDPLSPTAEVQGFTRIGGTGRIVFGGGVPVGGWTQMVVFPDGSYNYSGHLHVSGATSYTVSVAWVLTTGSGHPSFVMPAKGRVHGTFEPGSRDFDWNRSGTNPALRNAWPIFNAQGYRWRWSAAANLDITPLVDNISKALGVVGAVVALL
ncbi:hypothetical protein [Rhodococcus jostii]|uniref:Uncharacterized protein n=1 Tax=Rhodococcus jostii TaxID=132919 RepID=A0A1H5HLY1_RHOJO|nr:hypothetical protein [Rhodococcus jostii]SEE28774.1 hypothetical protein SAMN04490220_7256 [Rhodococcus jostii]